MRHFIEIKDLSKTEILSLIDKASYFKKNINYPNYCQQIVANLFYENSTRTRVSFELAEKKLSMQVINLNMDSSSEQKGEILTDTIENLAAMGINLFVIRHSQNEVFQKLINLSSNVQFINAGNGTNAHPSQAMLDAMTIMEQKSDFSSLKVTIIGDIKHSRVANSLQVVLAKLGVRNLTLVAPDLWQPQKILFGTFTNSLTDGLEGADVVICLRVQKERLLHDETIDLDYFRKNYTLTLQNLKLAKNDAMVMHPGPINRGVEMEDEVVASSQSCILQQVTNGVYMRMAIMDLLVTSQKK